MSLVDDEIYSQKSSRKRSERPAVKILDYVIYFHEQTYKTPRGPKFTVLEKQFIAFLESSQENYLTWMFPLVGLCHSNLYYPGSTLLHVAVDCGTLILAEWLLQKGIDPDLRDHVHGHTALFSKCHSESVVRLLLSYNANPNISSDVRDLPIHICRSHVIMELLIAHGSEINEPNGYWATPLSNAYFWEDEQTIEVLEKSDVIFNASQDGFSDIHYASSCNKTTTVEKMLNLKFGAYIEEQRKLKRIL